MCFLVAYPHDVTTEQLVAVLERLDQAFGLVPWGAEVTTEANPESVTRDSLQRLPTALGLTRASLECSRRCPRCCRS